MQFEWILFDADNTIFDFHASSEIAFHKSFEKHGIKSNEEVYAIFRKLNAIAWKAFDENRMTHEEIKSYRFSALFREMGITDLDPLEFNALYFSLLVQNIRYEKGARNLLAQIEGYCKMAIITNGMKEVQRPRLENSEIHSYFDRIFVSGEIGFSKPNPAYFDHVYTALGDVAKEKVLVVGDNIIADIKGGADFGFKTAWYNPHQLENTNGVIPDFEIEALSALKEIIFED
jgi:2-haloacid dehalogenase